MKQWLSVMLTACLLLFPFATFAADYESQPSDDTTPPVAQALMREGDFAVKLAVDLNLGDPADEAAAENMLAVAGVSPLNGWISDYPVTPEIVGQLGDSISRASAEGKLTMSGEEAARELHQLVAELNLPEPQGSESAPLAQTDQTAINDYYSSTGPPIVTYYPPPDAYAYLYDWVPYPVVWFGFSFPGFFICHNFTRTVFVPPFLSVNGRFDHRRAIVSNRFFDRSTGHFLVVDHAFRTRTGAFGRPMTTIRGEGGRSFRPPGEMRHGSPLNGIAPPRNDGFRSPQARKSARQLFSGNVQAMNNARTGNFAGNAGTRSWPRTSMSGPPAMRGGEVMHGFSAGGSARSFSRPMPGGPGPGMRGPVRSFGGPVMGGRSAGGSGTRFSNQAHGRG